MDEFSSSGFNHVFNLRQISSGNWHSEVADFDADLLIVESAWFGLNSSWHNKINRFSSELEEVLRYCKTNLIPTIFWNKEDPVHFDEFLNTSAYFDFVFTTDMDSISKYKTCLKHNRIYLLPFACDPKVFNPVVNQPKKDEVFFAGAYYQKYHNRKNNFDNIVDIISKYKKFDIYDRYFSTKNNNYRFPKKYKKYIRGFQHHSTIGSIYKQYRYGLNINTVVHSSTMFSRRVFELLGCGCIAVSNFSVGVDIFFGKIVIADKNLTELENALSSYFQNKLLGNKLALLGLRKVMGEHTYQERADRICNLVLGRINYANNNLRILVIVKVFSIETFLKTFEMLQLQNYKNIHIIIYTNSISPIEYFEKYKFNEKITVLHQFNRDSLLYISEKFSCDWVTFFHHLDFYGESYLFDLILAQKYSDVIAFSKPPVLLKDQKSLLDCNSYSFTKEVYFRSCLLKIGSFSNEVSDFINSNSFDSKLIVDRALNIDPFNYVKNYSNDDAQSNLLDAIKDLSINIGQDILSIYKLSESQGVFRAFWLGKPGWRPEKISLIFGDRFTGLVVGSLDHFGWHIISELPDGETCDLFSEFAVPIEDLGGKSGTLIYLEAGVGLQMQLFVRFELPSGALLDEAIFEVNTQSQLTPPDSCTHIRLGYRITSSGSSRITRLVLA